MHHIWPQKKNFVDIYSLSFLVSFRSVDSNFDEQWRACECEWMEGQWWQGNSLLFDFLFGVEMELELEGKVKMWLQTQRRVSGEKKPEIAAAKTERRLFGLGKIVVILWIWSLDWWCERNGN